MALGALYQDPRILHILSTEGDWFPVASNGGGSGIGMSLDDLPSRWIRPYFLQSPILTKLCFVRFLHVFLLRTQFFMCCMFLLWCTTFWCHGFFMSCCLTSCLRVSVLNSRFLKFACGCKTRLTCPPSNVPISFQVCRCSHVTDLPPLSSLAASAASKRIFLLGL